MAAYGPHYDKDQWHKSTEYIPERFDPNSELFSVPNSEKYGSSKSRHPRSMVPFSCGPRICPGQILATVESKVVIARLIFRMEYDVDQDLLDNPTAQFNVNSQWHLKGTIRKLY